MRSEIHGIKNVRGKIKPSWLKKQLIKLYIKSPQKVQFVFAKYGVKNALKKNKSTLEKMLKH